MHPAFLRGQAAGLHNQHDTKLKDPVCWKWLKETALAARQGSTLTTVTTSPQCRQRHRRRGCSCLRQLTPPLLDRSGDDTVAIAQQLGLR